MSALNCTSVISTWNQRSVPRWLSEQNFQAAHALLGNHILSRRRKLSLDWAISAWVPDRLSRLERKQWVGCPKGINPIIAYCRLDGNQLNASTNAHFTPKSDKFQISSITLPETIHHTVWRTWLFIAYSLPLLMKDDYILCQFSRSAFVSMVVQLSESRLSSFTSRASSLFLVHNLRRDKCIQRTYLSSIEFLGYELWKQPLNSPFRTASVKSLTEKSRWPHGRKADFRGGMEQKKRSPTLRMLAIRQRANALETSAVFGSHGAPLP